MARVGGGFVYAVREVDYDYEQWAWFWSSQEIGEGQWEAAQNRARQIAQAKWRAFDRRVREEAGFPEHLLDVPFSVAEKELGWSEAMGRWDRAMGRMSLEDSDTPSAFEAMCEILERDFGCIRMQPELLAEFHTGEHWEGWE